MTSIHAGKSPELLMDAPTKLDLQREGIEYDRRQIRRKLRERLLDRGEDLEEDDDVAVDDEESVYEDTEFFPWKQREAAVEAAALGGRTEGRMEGFDSLERALQAHTHKLHYGRGRGFGWSNQQQHSGVLGERQRSNEVVRNQLTDWTSFRNLNVEVDAVEEKSENREEDTNQLIQNQVKDLKAMKAQQRHANMLNTVYLLSAIILCLGFAYYVEVLKIDTYESYLPLGVTEEKPVDHTIATSTGGNSNPAARTLETRYAHKILKADAAPTEADAKFIGFREILASHFSDRADLQTEGTSQYNAVFWLSHHDAMALVVPSSKAELDHLVQRYALATLYFATSGNEWSFADHFMTGLHECEWHVGNPADKVLFGASQCEGGKVTSLILSKLKLLHGVCVGTVS
jgi:hypothetical protein